MNKQRGRIRTALLRGEKLTRIEAQDLYGVGRLAARIDELKKEMTIIRGWRKVKTRFEDTETRIREYWAA